MSRLFALCILVLLAGCDSRSGRYVVTSGTPPIMVDSTTGESWRLIYDEGNNPRWAKLQHDMEPSSR